MFRKRWTARVDASELRERMADVQRAAEASGFQLVFVGGHHCGSEEVLLYSDRNAQDRSQALCLQLDLNPPWGGGKHAVLVWGRRITEVVQASDWLKELQLVCDEVLLPQGALTAEELFDFGLRQIGHVFRPATVSLLSEALSSTDPELREAASRVIGTLQLASSLPEVAAALEREEHPTNRATYEEALQCLTGDAPDVRWLPGDFDAACAQAMTDMPEQVVLYPVEPGTLAWGGPPPYKSFELQYHPTLCGVTLEVFPCPDSGYERLPTGLPQADCPVPVQLVCDPRYSAERYSAFAAALADAADPSAFLFAAERAMNRTQSWALRPLSAHAHRFDAGQQERWKRLLALPHWLPDLPLTPPMLLAGLEAVP